MDLSRLEQVFSENFIKHGELGASVSVWKDGQEVLNLASGWCEREHEREWKVDTLIPVYSATKGAAAATLLMVLDESGLTPDSRVTQVWRDFPHSDATFAEMMSHQCGIAALDIKASVFDYDAVINAIEQQSPNWSLGDGHGYHPRTYGFLLDHCVRILTGESLANVWRDKVAGVLGLDFHIGLDEKEFSRVAKLYPGKMDKADLESGFYKEFNQRPVPWLSSIK